VYLIANNRKYWISSAYAMDAYGFDWNKIVYLPQSVIASYPRGGDLEADAPAPASVVVPDVRWQTVSEAFAAITAAGLSRGTVRYYPDPTCENIGLVTSQTPRAAAVVPAGTAVNLSVGRLPSTPCF
jgi:PASTA domain